jgi:hypothetical protein
MQLQDEVISSDAERLRMTHSNVKMVTYFLYYTFDAVFLLENQHSPSFKGSSSSLPNNNNNKVFNPKCENNILEKKMLV